MGVVTALGEVSSPFVTSRRVDFQKHTHMWESKVNTLFISGKFLDWPETHIAVGKVICEKWKSFYCHCMNMWTFKRKALMCFGADPLSGSQTEHLETLGWFVCNVFQPTGFLHPDMEQWHKLWFGHSDSSRWWHLSQHFHVECKQDHKTRKIKETLIIKQNTNMPKYLHKNSKIWVIIWAWIFCSL